MFNEDIFNFNINNIKNDLAIEGMTISDEDITLFKQFATEEIDMPNLIQTIKNEINWNLQYIVQNKLLYYAITPLYKKYIKYVGQADFHRTFKKILLAPSQACEIP